MKAPSSMILFVLLCLINTCLCVPVNKNLQQESESSRNSTSSTFSSVVNSLLSSLLRQTLYNRMENLLLDPGKRSNEKQRIVESAVENYQQQDFAAAAEEGSDDGESHTDFSKLAGYWIRATSGPTVMASVEEGGSSGGGGSVTSTSEDKGVNSFKTEKYNITDLFAMTTTNTVNATKSI